MTPHLFAVEVDVFQVEGVNMARQESRYHQPMATGLLADICRRA